MRVGLGGVMGPGICAWSDGTGLCIIVGVATSRGVAATLSGGWDRLDVCTTCGGKVGLGTLRGCLDRPSGGISVGLHSEVRRPVR